MKALWRCLILGIRVFVQLLTQLRLAIIILTVLIRMLLWPLTQRQTKSMLAMKEINPKLQNCKKKYKNQPEN